MQRHSFSRTAGPRQAHLRLLATTDLHMHLHPHDYVTDRPAGRQGLALAAQTVRRARAEAANALYFDVGDAFEGSPLDGALAEEAAEATHPMVAAFAAAGLTAMTLGNHDFNFGLQPLEGWLSRLSAPAVLANLVRHRGATPLDDEPFLPPFALVPLELRCGDRHRRPLMLGVIGLAPPQTLDWDAPRLLGQLEARDMVEAARAWVPEMRKGGADLVVALCHSGLGDVPAMPGAEHAAACVAGLDGVDAVMAGHSHRRFPAPDFAGPPRGALSIDPVRGLVQGTPVAMAGFWGRDVAQIDLLLDVAGPQDAPDPAHGVGPTTWRIAESACALRPVRARHPDPAVLRTTAPHHDRTLAHIRHPIGQSAHRLHSYFALLSDSPAVRLCHAMQLSVGAALLADRPERALPCLSAVAPMKAGGLHGPRHYTDVPAGVIRRQHLNDLYMYRNMVQVVRLPGAALRLWLERSVSLFHRFVPGQRDAPLHDPAHASYGFDTISGVTYCVDLTEPAAFDAGGRQVVDRPSRIRELAVAGRRVRDHDLFSLVTNDYRLHSPAGFPPVPPEDRLATADLPLREGLERFVAEGGATGPLPEPSWSFLPLPKTTATFLTGPGARTVSPEARPEAGAVTRVRALPNGFDLWRFDLSVAAHTAIGLPARDLAKPRRDSAGSRKVRIRPAFDAAQEVGEAPSI